MGVPVIGRGRISGWYGVPSKDFAICSLDIEEDVEGAEKLEKVREMLFFRLDSDAVRFDLNDEGRDEVRRGERSRCGKKLERDVDRDKDEVRDREVAGVELRR